MPLEFLPEARRKAVYASFTRTPKHKKNLALPSKKLRDQHKESDYLKIIQRYGSGDVQHAQSHDLKHLKDWVETLETNGLDVGLASATPHYYQTQGKIHKQLMEELLFQLNIKDKRLGSLFRRVWMHQYRLFLKSVDTVYTQSNYFRGAEKELYSLAEKSGLHAKRLQSDKERLAFNQALVEDRLFNSNVEREVAIKEAKEFESELKRAQDLILKEIENGDSSDDEGNMSIGHQKHRRPYKMPEGEGSDSDEEFKEWHVRKRMETAKEIGKEMEKIHMSTAHEQKIQAKLLKDLSKTVRITEKKLKKLSSLYGPRTMVNVGVETPEEWKTGNSAGNDEDQDIGAPPPPQFKLKGLTVPYRLRMLLPKFKSKHVRVMAREKAHRAILQIYTMKYEMDVARSVGSPKARGTTGNNATTFTLEEVFIEYCYQKARSRNPGSPLSPYQLSTQADESSKADKKKSPSKDAYVFLDVLYEILHAVRQYKSDPRMTFFGECIGAFDEPMETARKIPQKAIDFTCKMLSQLRKHDFLPPAVFKDGGGGSTTVIAIDRGTATSKLRPYLINAFGTKNMSKVTGFVNKLPPLKKLTSGSSGGGDRMVDLDLYLQMLCKIWIQVDLDWDAHLRHHFETHCKWYKRAFGIVVEMDPSMIMELRLTDQLIDDGYNIFGVIDYEQWTLCLNDMHFNVGKKRANEWFEEGCAVHRQLHEKQYQLHWKQTTIFNWTNPDTNKVYPGYTEYWYNEATNQTKWECPHPPEDGSATYVTHELDFSSFATLCKKRNILKVK